MCEFSIEMWVGLQISVEKFAFLEKNRWVLKMLRKKIVTHGKKLVGWYHKTPGTNFRHTFRKFSPDPRPVQSKIGESLGLADGPTNFS